MKRIITSITACALLASACENSFETQKDLNQEEQTELIPISLQINGASTKAAESFSTENQIDDLQVFVYKVDSKGSKSYDSYYSFDGEHENQTIYVDPNCDAASYWIVAYANHPKISISETLQDWSLFSNESSSKFQMVGKCEITAEKILADKAVDIHLLRQCSKVSVDMIELSWKNTANRYKTFKLKGMYLMDVPGVIKNYFDINPEIMTDYSLWVNKNGYSSSQYDALLYDQIPEKDISEEASYNTGHVFYGYISPQTTYNNNATWAPGGTRLVIEAEFDGKPSYYAVGLNGIGDKSAYEDLRNMHIKFNKITITRPGADAPYKALPEESPLTVSVSVLDWDSGYSGNYTIQ